MRSHTSQGASRTATFPLDAELQAPAGEGSIRLFVLPEAKKRFIRVSNG